jgi:hypothetical protein
VTASEWDEKYHELINYLNANPHIAATYPFMESVPNDMRDIIIDLAAAEASLAEYKSKWDALATLANTRLDQKIEAEASLVRIREALQKYGRHHHWCEILSQSSHAECDCGLNSAIFGGT